VKKFSELPEKLKKDKDDPCWKGYVQVGMKKKNGKEVPNCVPKESTNEKFDVKYAKSKRGPISVRSFDSANDAKKFLDSMRKQGFNGIISKKGQPVSMQRMKDMQKESVDEAMSLADIRRKKEREDRRKRDHGDETQHQRMMRKVYGNMMGGLKKEEVEGIDEDYMKSNQHPMDRSDAHHTQATYHTQQAAQAKKAGDNVAHGQHRNAARHHTAAGDAWARHATKVKKGMNVSPPHQMSKVAHSSTQNAHGQNEEVGINEAPGKYSRRGDKEMYQWGDINQALMAVGMRTAQIANVLTKLSQKEVGVKEDLDEAVNYFNVAKAFDDYAKKHGGIDKKDFMKVGAFVRQLGRESDVNKQDKTFMAMKKYISAMDTDPRDGVIQIFQKHGMWKNGRIMREGLEEKAVSKAQQKFFGMVRAKQKGEMDDASPEVAKAAKSMSKKDVKDFAKTKHKGLPDKVDEVNKAHNTMFKAAFRKKEAEREKAERENRLRAKGWVRNDRGGMSKVKESTELTEFSDAQLQQLKKAYADLEKINVTSPTYKKLKAMIARMDKGALEKVARAKIRFVSQIAARELAAKGVKLKAGEYMESVQEGVIDDYNALKAKGKSDSAAIDIMMSMAKYRNMTRDQLSKKVGDARRKGIFKR